MLKLPNLRHQHSAQKLNPNLLKVPNLGLQQKASRLDQKLPQAGREGKVDNSLVKEPIELKR